MAERRVRRRRSIPIEEVKVNRVDAVLASDIEIRSEIPVCRTDDFISAMWRKLEFIVSLCKKHGCPLLIGGDIGDKNQWKNWLLEKFISIVKGVDIVACLGQHDLPAHNLEELPASGCGVLSASGIIAFWESDFPNSPYRLAHWGEDPSPTTDNQDILITHRMVINSKTDYPGQDGIRAIDLLNENPQYKLILTGDNHIPFVVKYGGRILVNPGSMMRTTADQADFRPRVYLWDSEQNEVEPVYLPIEEGVVVRTHIDKKEDRDERRQALIDRIRIDYETGFSFEENMEISLREDPEEKPVEDKIWEAIEKE